MRGISWLAEQLFDSLDKQGFVKWPILSPFGGGGGDFGGDDGCGSGGCGSGGRGRGCGGCSCGGGGGCSGGGGSDSGSSCSRKMGMWVRSHLCSR